jgi:GNAT superfamily N-acetyltransferase
MSITATASLAARIDGTEGAMLREFADSVRRMGQPATVWSIAGATAVLGAATSPFNKLIGLGFAGVPDVVELERIEHAHADASARLQVELSTLADPAVATLLTTRGYRLIGFENVLGKPLEKTQAQLAAGVSVDVTRPDEEALWIETLVDAFLHPDVFDGPASHESFDRAALERAYEESGGVPGMLRMLARLNGQIAGGGALFILDQTALLCGAATLPASRRRGVQASLLSARLAFAAERGCDLAVVTTQPGSVSQANVQKAGFELIYSRAVLTKDP